LEKGADWSHRNEQGKRTGREHIMPTRSPIHILTINSGSSSLKFALYEVVPREALILSGRQERIGFKGGLFRVENGKGEVTFEEHDSLRDHEVAIERLIQWLHHHLPGKEVSAVGHRLVLGGVQYGQPHLITPELLAALTELLPLAPDHLPHELKTIKAVKKLYPHLKQVACFDTSFHRTMLHLAQIYPIPRHLQNEGVIRYGFHGLSYEYIMKALREEAGAREADGRVIVAHLGNGASMVAVHHGKSVDTTMGLTPAGGLVMGTRPGDLDPGVVLYLLEKEHMRPEAINHILNQQSGLLGVSSITSDMQVLLGKEEENPNAAEAIDLFCYQARKFLGALAAVLGGLDTLIFTGGIGENAPPIRWRICQDMAFLGIELDADLNAANAAVISKQGRPVTVRVMKTNEELMIARHTMDVIRGQKE
jgi:acetate kinase